MQFLHSQIKKIFITFIIVRAMTVERIKGIDVRIDISTVCLQINILGIIYLRKVYKHT